MAQRGEWGSYWLCNKFLKWLTNIVNNLNSKISTSTTDYPINENNSFTTEFHRSDCCDYCCHFCSLRTDRLKKYSTVKTRNCELQNSGKPRICGQFSNDQIFTFYFSFGQVMAIKRYWQFSIDYNNMPNVPTINFLKSN